MNPGQLLISVLSPALINCALISYTLKAPSSSGVGTGSRTVKSLLSVMLCAPNSTPGHKNEEQVPFGDRLAGKADAYRDNCQRCCNLQFSSSAGF